MLTIDVCGEQLQDDWLAAAKDRESAKQLLSDI